jgi:hypothetical protein
MTPRTYSTHDQTILVGGLDHERRDLRLPEGAIGLQPPLPANQIEGIAVGSRFADHGDRPLETNLADIFDDTLEHFAITCTRIDDRDLV